MSGARTSNPPRSDPEELTPLSPMPLLPGSRHFLTVRIISADNLALRTILQGGRTRHPFWAAYIVQEPGLNFILDDGDAWPVGWDDVVLMPPLLPFRHRFPTGLRHCFVLFEMPHIPLQLGLRACGGQPIRLSDPGLVAAYRAFSADAKDGMKEFEQTLRAQSIAASTIVSLLHHIPADMRYILMEPHRSAGGLQPVLDWIEEPISHPVMVADLANLLERSEGHCGRLFRQHLGCSPVSWIINRRVQRVGMMLTETTLSLDRITELSGLGSRRFMSRLFRRQFGVCPSRFRQNIQKSSAAPK